ncbi:MAG: addiction module antidote protein, partial [Spirochaetaceae bacterium]
SLLPSLGGYALHESAPPPFSHSTPGDGGRSSIAKRTGLGRESLYKALSPEGNPEFATVLKVVHALGLRLRAVPGG